MWVLVFVMAAGPLPLGIPRAEAAPSVTDLPGLQNFYSPKVFIVFDTSKSMAVPAGGPEQRSRPRRTTTGTRTSPPRTPRVATSSASASARCTARCPSTAPASRWGSSGYNQYYQLTTRPSTLGTQCTYDRIALGYTGSYTFGPVLDDLDGTGPAGPTGLAAVPFSYTPPGLGTSHPTRKWVVQTGPSGDILSKNVGNGTGGAGSQMQRHAPPRSGVPGRRQVAARRHVHLRLVPDRQHRGGNQPRQGRRPAPPPSSGTTRGPARRTLATSR